MSKRIFVAVGVFFGAALILIVTTMQPTTSRQQAVLTPKVSSSTPSPVEGSSVPTGWQTLKVSQFNFQLSYPQGWTVAKNVTDSGNQNSSTYSVDLVSGRPDKYDSRETNIVPVVVSVYDAPPVPMSQWLNAAFHTDVSVLEKGDIDGALADAYSDKTDIFYNEFRQGGTTFYGVGGGGGPVLVYATYIVPDSSKFIYAVEIHLPLGNADEIGQNGVQPDQYDTSLIGSYKQMVSSLTRSD